MTVTADLVWSKSQWASFRSCQRKGLFSTVVETVNGVDVKALRALKNRFLWAGAHLHDHIGVLVKRASHGEPFFPLEESLETLRQRMRDDYSASLKNTNPEGQLFEHAYRSPVPKEAWAHQWSRVEAALRAWYASPWPQFFSNLDVSAWKAVNDVLSFHVGPVRSYVKFDVAYEIDGEVHLIDWVTAKKSTANRLDYALHALYAVEVWGAALEAVTVHTVPLSSDDETAFQFEPEDLDPLNERLLSEAQTIQNWKDSWKGQLESVPSAQRLEDCDSCSFRRACGFGDFSNAR